MESASPSAEATFGKAVGLRCADVKEVLILVAAGLTNARIARRLGLSCATVRTHIEHILSKLRVRSRSAAVARAVVTGMLEG